MEQREGERYSIRKKRDRKIGRQGGMKREIKRGRGWCIKDTWKERNLYRDRDEEKEERDGQRERSAQSILGLCVWARQLGIAPTSDLIFHKGTFFIKCFGKQHMRLWKTHKYTHTLAWQHTQRRAHTHTHTHTLSMHEHINAQTCTSPHTQNNLKAKQVKHRQASLSKLFSVYSMHTCIPFPAGDAFYLHTGS